MAFLLSLLTLGCYKSKPVTFDFGHGSIDIPSDFRLDVRNTDRDPDSVRFTFTRVNDTHLNGQTSYAEHLVVSHLAPTLTEPEFRTLLNKGRFDALSTKQPYSVETEAGLEFQISSAQYTQHPVSEPAIVIRLIDFPHRRVLGWYGYAKRYKLPRAKQYLSGILASLKIDPALDARFPDYVKWQGNDWMGAYFDNKDRLIAALASVGLELPYQPYIGSVSSWESKGNLHAAIDGERPGSLHLVEVSGNAPCASIQDISPDLRQGFRQIFGKQPLPACFQVYKFNIWQKLPAEGNPIQDWIHASLRSKP